MPIAYQPIESRLSSLLPPAEQVRDLFPVKPHPQKKDQATYDRIMGQLRFGRNFTDYMAHMTWKGEEGWHDRRIEPYGPLSLDPACSVLHYGQEVFEGIKAYRHADGSIWTFRPGFNAARLRYSCQRLALPQVSDEDFVGSLAALISADSRWVPSGHLTSLYLRPFLFSSESFLGVHSGNTVEYMVIASPSGPYFVDGFKPVDIWVTKDYYRAAPGGTGAAKCGGNYAAGLVPQHQAYERGYQQVLFLDAATGRNLEELGGMNVFVVYKDGHIATPELTGSILEGGTRAAIIQLATEMGRQVEQTAIDLEQLVCDIQSGVVTELFACGTAAIVTPIGKLGGEDFTAVVSAADTCPVTRSIYEKLTGIQYGTVADEHDWMYRLA